MRQRNGRTNLLPAGNFHGDANRAIHASGPDSPELDDGDPRNDRDCRADIEDGKRIGLPQLAASAFFPRSPRNNPVPVGLMALRRVYSRLATTMV